jgi:hypothetical protein
MSIGIDRLSDPMPNGRVKFAKWGVLSLSSMVTGILIGVVGALAQNNVIADFSILGIEFLRYAAIFSLLPILFGFALGWVALHFGRQLHCCKCGGFVLPSDEMGFRGLRVRPIVAALQGVNVCHNCFWNK